MAKKWLLNGKSLLQQKNEVALYIASGRRACSTKKRVIIIIGLRVFFEESRFRRVFRLGVAAGRFGDRRESIFLVADSQADWRFVADRYVLVLDDPRLLVQRLRGVSVGP